LAFPSASTQLDALSCLSCFFAENVQKVPSNLECGPNKGWGCKMLLRFGARNFRSIQDYQAISFVASKLHDTPDVEQAVMEHGKYKVLPVLLLYGANASGKTNMLSSLSFMRRFILTSHSSTSEPEGIRRTPFLLDEDGVKASSQFDCDLVINDVRYHYGFEVDDSRVLSEWLFSYPDSRKNVLFTRLGAEPIYLGPNLPDRAKARRVVGLERANSLFLSAAAQNNVEIAQTISAWFRRQLGFIRPQSDLRSLTVPSKWIDENEIREKVLSFIRHADPAIVGALIKEEKLSEPSEKFRSDMTILLRKHLGEDFKEPSLTQKVVQLTHKGAKGEVAFDLEYESSGTRKLLQTLGATFRLLERGGLLLFDELEASLHPAVATQLISMFNARSINSKGAQLLVATHDTNLLDLNFFRRDQIWFAEKSAIGATHVYSLGDLSVRKGDNIKRGYLQGRFGAIPFFPSPERLYETA
jgi:AAA15 family ATPase/GTPase